LVKHLYLIIFFKNEQYQRWLNEKINNFKNDTLKVKRV
jgi:hypothetical protein